MKKIKIIQISDNIRSQLLVGNVYKLSEITDGGMARTKCGRFFYEGEYEVIEGSKSND